MIRITDEPWALIEPHLPALPSCQGGRGRPWHSDRECLDGILWVQKTGAQWKAMPKEFPGYATCWHWLRMWEEHDVQDVLPDPRPQAPALEHNEPGPLARHSASAIPAKPRPRKPRAKWAELLKRVYLFDVLTCPCGGKRSLIAPITGHEVIVKILDELGLPSEPPQVTPARAPPHRGDHGMTEG